MRTELATNQLRIDIREDTTFKVLGRSILTMRQNGNEPSEGGWRTFSDMRDAAMEAVGISPFNGNPEYLCINSRGEVREMDIVDLMQCEIDKNGTDFVQFDDGRYGFVGYGNHGVSGWTKILWVVRNRRLLADGTVESI